MSRRIVGLRWARRSGEVPSFATGVSRPRGAKKDGLKYEKMVAEAVPNGERSVWWEFEDANGPGFCQTDIIISGRESVLVLECKLSANSEAWVQLEQLYVPVLALALGKEIFGCQVAKVLYGKPPGVVCKTLGEALVVARQGQRPLVHWKGLSPLVPSAYPMDKQ